MRNLKLLSSVCFEIQKSHGGFSHISVDDYTGSFYAATDDGVLVQFDPSSQQVIAETKLGDEFTCPVVDISYLPDQMSLCIAMAQGDILLWNSGVNNTECVGTVDGGITGMRWSPDLQMVALTTGLNRLVLMTRDFDPVTEVSLMDEGFGEAQPIAVGWGKKETQFHGSEGKKAAVSTTTVVNRVLSWDDHKPRISWREDGLFFSVSFINSVSGGRQIRVWTRDGILHSTNEATDGLGQSLCYKPSGNLIASSATSHDKHRVVFFEKNGLRHGEFSLPFKSTDVKVLELRWNMESTVLAVWCEDLPKDDQFLPRSYIQLWTCGNYHWYMKQCLEFGSKDDEKASSFCWDREFAYRLHVVLGSGEYLQHNWTWTVSSSSGGTVGDLASVAVIDGNQVIVTPFRLMVVPPPLGAYVLQLKDPALQVAFGASDHCNDIVVLTLKHQLLLFTSLSMDKGGEPCGSGNSVECLAAGGNGFSTRCPLPRLRASVSLNELLPSTTSSLSHLTCVANDCAFVFSLNDSKQMTFVEILVDWNVSSFTVKSKLLVEKSVIAVACGGNSNTVTVQLVDGQLFKYDAVNGILTPWTNNQDNEVKFPLACSQMSVGTIGGEEVVFGLTERYRFFVNEIEIANNCSSFALHSEFLLLTTHLHTIRCICRKTPVGDLKSVQASKTHIFDETVRRIERGSRIISAVPEDTKVVLQMPRGNIESIHPRALILSVIRKHLDRLEYGKAFELAKKHRISLNLLYDHSPTAFTSNVETFILQLNSPSNINLFLTDLVEDDVTVTMYTFAYGSQPSRQAPSVPPEKSLSKLNVISDTLRKALEKTDEQKYILSILTTFVKRSAPDLQSALQRIKSLKENGDSAKITYSDALEYLLYLVDVNKLYDVALGMYDFDLVLMVAEKSQKDPKEYLAFLRDLRKMDRDYCCYSIDMHLKHFSKALQHISKCGKEHFSKCLELVIGHSLYSEALKLFPANSAEYREISVAYGEHLAKSDRYQEAGIILFRAGEHHRALEMFEACCDWRQAVCMASILNFTPNELSDLSRRMARKLKDNRRHLEASVLLEQYADDYEEAIVTLIAGYQWPEALRLIYRYKRADFIETDLKPAILEAFGHHKALIEGQSADYCRYSERLRTVRRLKQERMEKFEFEDKLQQPDNDLYSDMSSVAGESIISGQTSRSESQKSRSSGRSTKSRSKHEKKKLSLREGSPYEEEALIEVLHKMACQVEKWKGDISSLLQVLVMFHRELEAVELQTGFDLLISSVEKCIPEIWTTDLMLNVEAQRPVFGPDSTVNSITKDLTNRRALPPTALRLGVALLAPPVLNKSKEWRMKILDRSK